MSVSTDAGAALRLTVPLPGGLPPGLSPHGEPPPPADLRTEVPIDQVGFRAVRSAARLQEIAHLRDAIALPADVRASPAFARLEKKETT